MSFEISQNAQNVLALAFISEFDDSVIKIYGSPTSQSAADDLIPASASDGIGSATLLCTVSVDGLGTGLTFDPAPVAGVVYKESTETWLGTNAASGYPSFYRLQKSADTGASSTTDSRCQGTVGTVAADLVIQSTYLTSGEEQRVDSFSVAVPAE